MSELPKTSLNREQLIALYHHYASLMRRYGRGSTILCLYNTDELRVMDLKQLAYLVSDLRVETWNIKIGDIHVF